MFQLFMLLYADNIVIFASTAEELQHGLNLLSDYGLRWKLKVNVSETKILIFQKGSILPRNLSFTYER